MSFTRFDKHETGNNTHTDNIQETHFRGGYKRRAPEDANGTLDTFNGIELLMELSGILSSSKSGMTFDAFVASIEDQHTKIRSNAICSPFYNTIIDLTGLTNPSLMDILKKVPSFAHVFNFFLKCIGKLDVSVAPNREINDSTFVDLQEYGANVLGDRMIKNTFTDLSIFELIHLDDDDFERMLEKLVGIDPNFAENFWDVFRKNGVHQAVISNQRDGYVVFMRKFFKEQPSDKDNDSLYTIKYDLLSVILSSINKNLPNERKKLNCFPWLTVDDAIEALATPMEKKTLPKPNVDRATELAKDMAVDDESQQLSIGKWLTTSKSFDLASTLVKHKVDVVGVTTIFSELGGDNVEDYKDFMDDEGFVKELLKKLLEKTKPLQAHLIIKALKHDSQKLIEK